MRRTAEEFRRQAITKGISRWVVRNCSFCRYPCGYLFLIGDAHSEVGYDSGCKCSTYPSPLQERTWDDVAEHYNIQSSRDVLKEYDEFWGFDSATARGGI